MVDLEQLIFDLDGTLVDSKKEIVAAVNFTLGELGFAEKSFEQLVSFIGSGVDDLIKKALGREGKNSFKKASLIFKDFFKKEAALKSKLYPHAKEVLEYFKNKQIYIVTNREVDVALVTLRNLGIDNYFSEVIGGDDIFCIKPSGCPVNKIIKPNLDRKKSMIVGDMDLDILSGKDAGILTCAVTYGMGKAEAISKAKPDYIIGSLLELKNIIA